MAYGAKSRGGGARPAYVALRKIQTAETEAASLLAAQRRDRALRELATLAGRVRRLARAPSWPRPRIGPPAPRPAPPWPRDSWAPSRRAQVRPSSKRWPSSSARTPSARAGWRPRRAPIERWPTSLTWPTSSASSAAWSITLSGQVLFASNEATLLPAATKSLDNVVAALKGVPANSGKVVIEGHTDSRGARSYNRDLAERRARAVRDYLVSRGMSSEQFAVDGVGPDRPVADNRSAEGRANNRRVEIVLPPGSFASHQHRHRRDNAGQAPTSTPAQTPTGPARADATAPAQTPLPARRPPPPTAPQAPRPTTVPPAGTPGPPSVPLPPAARRPRAPDDVSAVRDGIGGSGGARPTRARALRRIRITSNGRITATPARASCQWRIRRPGGVRRLPLTNEGAWWGTRPV